MVWHKVTRWRWEASRNSGETKLVVYASRGTARGAKRCHIENSVGSILYEDGTSYRGAAEARTAALAGVVMPAYGQRYHVRRPPPFRSTPTAPANPCEDCGLYAPDQTCCRKRRRCAECGADITRRHINTVFCKPCRADRRRAKGMAAQRRQRAKAPPLPVRAKTLATMVARLPRLNDAQLAELLSAGTAERSARANPGSVSAEATP